MAVHVIAINNRIASIGADAELICNNPTDTIRFEFDDEWSEHTTKTARFSWENRYIDVVFTGNEVKTPEIYRTNYVFVGVYADNITSTPVKIRCKYSIKCMGGIATVPVPDVYTQLLERINGIKNGEDGVGIKSITVHDSTITGGANRVTITLTDGTSKSFNVQNGRDGARGSTGSPGADGISPVVSVEPITGGNRVTITDVNGAQSFDVMDGIGSDGDALTEDSVLVEHIADETWSEIDSRINAALGVVENGAY